MQVLKDTSYSYSLFLKIKNKKYIKTMPYLFIYPCKMLL